MPCRTLFLRVNELKHLLFQTFENYITPINRNPLNIAKFSALNKKILTKFEQVVKVNIGTKSQELVNLIVFLLPVSMK